MLTGSDDDTAHLWGALTGGVIQKFEGHLSHLTSVAFSPDNRYALTGSWDHTARLWDIETGKELRMFQGHSGVVWSVKFSPDGRHALTGSADRTTRLWDARTGQELCRLISFQDGAWAVLDREGRYDASNQGEVAGLHGVVGNEIIELSQLKTRCYDPGLLAKHLSHHKEPLRNTKNTD